MYSCFHVKGIALFVFAFCLVRLVPCYIIVLLIFVCILVGFAPKSVVATYICVRVGLFPTYIV